MVASLKKVRTARRIAANMARARTLVAGGSVGALRVALGMPRNRFARLVGRTERCVIEWEAGRALPQGLSQQRVRELEQLTQALRELFGTKSLGSWFDLPNRALGGFKPVELIERGESGRLWQMIFELRSGAHA